MGEVACPKCGELQRLGTAAAGDELVCPACGFCFAHAPEDSAGSPTPVDQPRPREAIRQRGPRWRKTPAMLAGAWLCFRRYRRMGRYRVGQALVGFMVLLDRPGQAKPE